MAASATEIRQVGLELQKNALALNTAVSAINTAIAAMNFKGIDSALPTSADLAALLIAYDAIVKPSNTITSALASVRADAA